MGYWFKLYQSRAKHPKTLRLAALIQRDRRHTCGLLDDLWTWGLDAADRLGRLNRLAPEDIAMALDYPPKKGKWLVDALVQSGFFDVDADGTYVLHDWDEYAGKLNDARAKDADRKRTERSQSALSHDNVRDMSDGRPKDVRKKSSKNPSLEKERDIDIERDRDRDDDRDGEREKDDRVTPPIAPHAGGGADKPVSKLESLQGVRFLEFWGLYPKKQGKGAAEKAYRKISPDRDLHMAILRAVTLQKQSDQWRKDNGQYIPNPATWLNQRRWEDEIQSRKPQGTGNVFLDILRQEGGTAHDED